MWATEGRDANSLQTFFDALSDEQKASIRAVSIDISAGYQKPIRATAGVPHAEVVFDPFHVCQLGANATDQVRRAEYNQHGRSGSDGVRRCLVRAHPVGDPGVGACPELGWRLGLRWRWLLAERRPPAQANRRSSRDKQWE